MFSQSLSEEPVRSQDDETRAIISETATLIWAVRTAKNVGAFEDLVGMYLRASSTIHNDCARTHTC